MPTPTCQCCRRDYQDLPALKGRPSKLIKDYRTMAPELKPEETSRLDHLEGKSESGSLSHAEEQEHDRLLFHAQAAVTVGSTIVCKDCFNLPDEIYFQPAEDIQAYLEKHGPV